MKIAVVGAPGTGKTRLVADLAEALAGRGFRHIVVVESSAPIAADLTLLTGLDLPGALSREEADTDLRRALARAGIAYRVVYGTGEERTRNALASVMELLGERPATAPGESRWQWSCEKCSDPDCEHRLFTSLQSSFPQTRE